MLYWLADLKSYFNALNVFHYITFRTGGALITAFLIALITGPGFIRWLKA